MLFDVITAREGTDWSSPVSVLGFLIAMAIIGYVLWTKYIRPMLKRRGDS